MYMRSDKVKQWDFFSIRSYLLNFTLDVVIQEYVRHQINSRRGDVTWIGGPWTCRKGLEHYNSFQRAGTTISVFYLVHPHN